LKSLIFFAVLFSLVAFPPPVPATTSGLVVDGVTGKPIPGALVTANQEVVKTDAKGQFLLASTAGKVGARAYGYGRAEQTAGAAPLQIKLTPFAPKALYLSFYGIGSRAIRQPALDLIATTELNALVIDVKGDRGMIPYKSSLPLATEVGAQAIRTYGDIKPLLASFREKGIYTIARIVVFKDNPLAQARPELAVKTAAGEIWRDREHLAWVDPFRHEVWDYNIDIAIEAAQLGFDEIQFDYLRFPDFSGRLGFSQPSYQENRLKAIAGFLAEAHKRLVPYNVFLAADIFGYVCWNLDDTGIGQRLEEIAPQVDYLSPMLYPSGFQFGIPGYRDPVAHVEEIVALSLKQAAHRSGLPPVRFRPWLQAFKDYAFDRRYFTGPEIRAQIAAVEHFGGSGWMLWNPRNFYSGEGLNKE
jgi:hypothetical protein